MDRVKMQQLSAWMGFVGIITIIGGVFSVISIAGIIPGIIAIILGIKLRSAKQYADAMLLEEGDEGYSGGFNMFIENLNSYFKIQGVLIIISLAMVVLAILLAIIFGFAAYSYTSYTGF